jgi:outer membrane protein OmpA-like peptidoglycan-associated protein
MSVRIWLCLPVVALALSGCATHDRSAWVSETRCADFSVQIYFSEYSAEITDAARQVLANAARQVKGCAAPQITVVGLADYQGASEANLVLSRKRAQAVAGLLQQNGFAAPTFRMAAAGDAGSITPAGQAEPLRRRADVFFDLP